MPEPDFDQIARRLLDNLPDTFLTRGSHGDEAIPGVAEQLRQVWNARGAADLKAVNGVDYMAENPDASAYRLSTPIVVFCLRSLRP